MNLNANQINELQTDIFVPLTSLETIELRSNRIKEVKSDSFGILPKLRTLDLGYNLINAIDEQLIDNTGIAIISLSKNRCYGTDIYDNSTAKDDLFLELQNCFKNYKIIENSEFYFFK